MLTATLDLPVRCVRAEQSVRKVTPSVQDACYNRLCNFNQFPRRTRT
jgi:hypothetical protein